MQKTVGLIAAGVIVAAVSWAAPVAASAQSPAPFVARAGSSVVGAGAVAVLPTVVKYKFKNCTAMNKVYPNGVGKNSAKDRTSGTPVTAFKHSTSLYSKIINYRRGLDRDHDGIACERA